MSLMREWKENCSQVKNVVLFISDALRWDYLPESISKLGVTFRTVSSSTWTPTSFSSILSGLFPPHHGVHSFLGNRLPVSAGSLFNLKGYISSLWTPNLSIRWFGGLPPIYNVLRQRNRISLKVIEPPFFYLEKDQGGHCPYGWARSDKYRPRACQNFFAEYGKREVEALRKEYEKGIERSAQVFRDRMQTLEERNLLDETLIIFASDHGELLGEYGGIVGHGKFTAPEIIYVPAVFIHPDLPRNVNLEDEGVLRHVDLYPTISDLLAKKVTNTIDGVSIFDLGGLPKTGFTYYFDSKFRLVERSVWDKDGGYVFREGINPASRLLRAVRITMLSKNGITAIYQRQRLRKLKTKDWLRNYIKLLKYLCVSSVKYGSPSFAFTEAKSLLKNESNTSYAQKKGNLRVT